jgi:hypothetical protein
VAAGEPDRVGALDGDWALELGRGLALRAVIVPEPDRSPLVALTVTVVATR